MGVDLTVKSTVDPTLYTKIEEWDLKTRWGNIYWGPVFEAIDFNINHLYGLPFCNYWSVEHVKDIYEALVGFRDLKEETFADDKDYLEDVIRPQIARREAVLPDLHALIADFKEFVENKCIIRVS